MSRELAEKLLKAFVDTGDMHMSCRELAVISAKEIERLLAAERKLMKCGHPKMCLVDWGDKMEGPAHTAYCSFCSELKKVREKCAKAAWNFMVAPGMYDEDDVADEIRQLDLTKLDEEKGGK